MQKRSTSRQNDAGGPGGGRGGADPAGTARPAARRDLARGLLPDDYLDALSDICQAAFWSRVLDDADRAVGATAAEDVDTGVVGFCEFGPERGGAPGGEIMGIYIFPE